MNTKTKLIAGLLSCGFLMLGLCQQTTNEPSARPKETNESKSLLVSTNFPQYEFSDTIVKFPTRTNWNGPTISLRQEGEEFFGIHITDSATNNVNAIEWRGRSNTPPIALTISTNLTVNWATIEEIPPSLGEVQYTSVQAGQTRLKQVGNLQTNRILTVVHDGATNLVLLKVLGKEEWPSQTRVVQVPARYRP